jgi:hypothetical protein
LTAIAPPQEVKPVVDLKIPANAHRTIIYPDKRYCEEVRFVTYGDAKKSPTDSEKLMVGHKNQRFHAVGIIPVTGCVQPLWVVAAIKSLPVFNCPRHPVERRADGSINGGGASVLTFNGSKPFGTLFVRCGHIVEGPLNNGFPPSCGANLYPTCSSAVLENIQNSMDEEDDRQPLVFDTIQSVIDELQG